MPPMSRPADLVHVVAVGFYGRMSFLATDHLAGGTPASIERSGSMPSHGASGVPLPLRAALRLARSAVANPGAFFGPTGAFLPST